MSSFRQGFDSGRRSKIGQQATPGFNEAPFAAMANRSNIIAQIKALLHAERPSQSNQSDHCGRRRGRRTTAQASSSKHLHIKDAETKREAIGAALGTVAADLSQDGMRNIWWFINAPQALTQIATKQGIASGAGKDGSAVDLE